MSLGHVFGRLKMVEQARCKMCKKTPRNCKCFEYRLEQFPGYKVVFVDNLATEPVSGEVVGTWQARRNGRVWRNPVYVDSFGPILRIFDEELAAEIEKEIEAGKFWLGNYVKREGCKVAELDKTMVKFRFMRSKTGIVEIEDDAETA
jgi:hypothetical protein